jgi:hypothetical protein
MTTLDTLSSNDVIGLAQKYLIGNYTRYPVCLVRGEGSYAQLANIEQRMHDAGN